MRYVNGVAKELIHVELLQALESERTEIRAPDLGRTLGASAQFVVAKLRPLVSAGLVTKHRSRTGRTYTISDEGRNYLMRNG